MAIIKPMIRSNICINSHPLGCAQDTRNQIAYVISKKAERGIKSAKDGGYAPKNVLVLGCSTGYGLASRIAAAFEYGANTIGVSFEKEATETKAGTPGFYNNLTFDTEAKKAGLKSVTFNMDAFSDECRAAVIEEAKKWGIKFDLVVYSLASPVRTDPDTKVLYKSVIKPIGKPFSGPALDMMTGKISFQETLPAEGDEIPNTVKVMGGEDWERWIKQLKKADVLEKGVRTVAYSYIGPKYSHPIYRDGTIGEAKKDLEARAHNIDSSLKALDGAGYVSVNKGLVTRSSAVIPIIAQYLGVIFKIMKKQGTHEGCIEQMERLFSERLYTADKKVPVDSENRIRIDDWEMSDAVQSEVDKVMPKVTEENLNELCDLEGLRHDFLMINGFDVPGVDYNKEIVKMNEID
ncbi:enoyl-ACP reductase FabV [Treponema pectinovorum]|uniref:enoyl-ACP reductase FabV n=1 Tax=Treponema pectinovorum TaxID=164 RepID=UPI0011CC5F82|nr:enoyl-ACP reductase FabV [Treponema pectinovorum]